LPGILIDTSSWIHALRPDGDERIRERVRAILDAGNALWCDMVRLELWNGVRGSHEKKVLQEIEAHLPCLKIDAPVWEKAIDLARLARDKGMTLPATDLIIAACARHHRVGLECCDKHFEVLESRY
jgi:predicted nucleic acid-binding protein